MHGGKSDGHRTKRVFHRANKNRYKNTCVPFHEIQLVQIGKYFEGIVAIIYNL